MDSSGCPIRTSNSECLLLIWVVFLLLLCLFLPFHHYSTRLWSQQTSSWSSSHAINPSIVQGKAKQSNARQCIYKKRSKADTHIPVHHNRSTCALGFGLLFSHLPFSSYVLNYSTTVSVPEQNNNRYYNINNLQIHLIAFRLNKWRSRRLRLIKISGCDCELRSKCSNCFFIFAKTIAAPFI